MGTNYYAKAPECPNPCQHCEAAVEVHIGKSLTMFEAHDEPPWGRIESWQDWKRILLQGVQVDDEYHSGWTVPEFISAVEGTSKKDRRRQYDAVMANPLWRSERDYLDADGFSFHRGEFS